MKVNFFEKLFFTIFIIVICFPFIPQVVKSSDTQPILTILFLLYPFFIIFKSKNLIVFKLNKQFLLYLLIIVCLIVVFLLNILLFNKPPVFSRYFAFIQFLIAVFFGLFLKVHLKNNWLIYILSAYVIFTIIYFLTNGLIEDILISSRENNSEDLINMGRGARTLSPEPSFFALHVFNLYVINAMLKNTVSSKIRLYSLGLISILLLSSLSGYGFLIFVFIMVIEYPKIVSLGFLGLLLFTPLFLNFFANYETVRAVELIIKIITESPFSIFESDASIASRLGSFGFYFTNIQENILLGDNFSIVEGGGLIGIISGIGSIGLVLFVALIINLFGFISNRKLFFMLLFWVGINFVSGPFGIATVGLIIGLIFRSKHNKVLSL